MKGLEAEVYHVDYFFLPDITKGKLITVVDRIHFTLWIPILDYRSRTVAV